MSNIVKAGAVAELKTMLESDACKVKFQEVLGKKANGFMASIMSVVNSNTALKDCDGKTILASAMIAATLDLPINQNLGFAYIIPYKNKGNMEAQFQLGFKGFIQLAMRTGQYRTMNVTEVYEGEIKYNNRFTGDIDFDMDGRTSNTVVGYLAYFKLLNGFEKYFYMTKEQIFEHAQKYSKTYKFGPWQTDFDSMAKKTVLKLMLSKWGILSTEMQTALKTDQAVVKNAENRYDPEVSYVDNPNNKEVVEVEYIDNDKIDDIDYTSTPFEEVTE